MTGIQKYIDHLEISYWMRYPMSCILETNVRSKRVNHSRVSCQTVETNSSNFDVMFVSQCKTFRQPWSNDVASFTVSKPVVHDVSLSATVEADYEED